MKTTSIKDKIEIGTNLLIILVVVLIGGSYVKARYDHYRSSLSVGDQIKSPIGYNWRHHETTLVVAVRKGCIYCERSYPLYRKLDGLEHDGHLKAHMLVVMPDDPTSGAELLRLQGITGQSVLNTPLNQMKVSGTPTLLLVDADGRLLRSWVGELDSSKADALVAELRR